MNMNCFTRTALTDGSLSGRSQQKIPYFITTTYLRMHFLYSETIHVESRRRSSFWRPGSRNSSDHKSKYIQAIYTY